MTLSTIHCPISFAEFCILDLDKYSNYIDLFIPSIHDANKIFTQKAALEFIKTFRIVAAIGKNRFCSLLVVDLFQNFRK